MSKMQNGSDALLCGHETRGCVGIIQQTSLEAYKAIIPTLGERQLEVFNVILEHPGFSNKDILHYLRAMNPKRKIEIGDITPRVNELRDKRLVDLHNYKQDPLTNKRVMTWEVI